VYVHYWDSSVGQCVAPTMSEAERLRTIAQLAPQRFRSLHKWRAARVRTELLMHVLHAWGAITWVR